MMAVGYVEKKIDFLVESAKAYCGTEANDFETRQMISLDILQLIGKLFAQPDHRVMRKTGDLLSVFPLLKKDAEGEYLQRLKIMEDHLLAIQIAVLNAEKTWNEGKENSPGV